jgi:hypothetical protein
MSNLHINILTQRIRFEFFVLQNHLKMAIIGAETCSVKVHNKNEHRHLLRTEVSIYIDWYTRNRMHNPIIKVILLAQYTIACCVQRVHITERNAMEFIIIYIIWKLSTN